MHFEVKVVRVGALVEELTLEQEGVHILLLVEGHAEFLPRRPQLIELLFPRGNLVPFLFSNGLLGSLQLPELLWRCD